MWSLPGSAPVFLEATASSPRASRRVGFLLLGGDRASCGRTGSAGCACVAVAP